MKFAIAVVLFALAMGVQSSIVPISLSHGPVIVGHSVHHHPAAVAVHAAHIAPVHVVTSPVVVPHVVEVVHAPATYVAKTLGAVHVAPLPGHSNSAASVNLEPAPGTA